MHVKARVAAKPTLHFGMFVGRVIVHDHMNLLAGRNDEVDCLEKFQPFLMAMAVIAHGDHPAIEVSRAANSVAVPFRL